MVISRFCFCMTRSTTIAALMHSIYGLIFRNRLQKKEMQLMTYVPAIFWSLWPFVIFSWMCLGLWTSGFARLIRLCKWIRIYSLKNAIDESIFNQRHYQKQKKTFTILSIEVLNSENDRAACDVDEIVFLKSLRLIHTKSHVTCVNGGFGALQQCELIVCIHEMFGVRISDTH